MGPFEMVGDDAPVCVDGVCALPAAEETVAGAATAEDQADGRGARSERR